MSNRSEALKEIRERAPPRPRPRLVCVNGKIVGDAVVVVSEDDPNWWRSMSVREGGKITIKDGRRMRWQ